MLREETTSPKLDRPSTVVKIVGFILVLEVISTLSIMSTLDTWIDRASFGSMFGAIGSLFSGLALAGVVYAILLQREELSLQRQELQLTRHELERSAAAQELSAQILRDQLALMREGQESQTSSERRKALPLFKPYSWSTRGGRMDLELTNHGATIAHLEVRNVIAATANLVDSSLIETGGRLKMIVETGSPTFSFELVFTDIRGDRRAAQISFNSSNKRLELREVAL